MLNKVRARNPIELPVEGWPRSRKIVAVLGGLVGVFLILPLIAVLVKGLVFFTGAAIVGLVSGIAALYITALFITPR